MAPNRSKSLYAIKECSTCGSWYTKECCSIGNLNDQIIVPVPNSSLHCAVCGTPVDGPYCHGCTLVRKKFDEDLLAYCVKNEIFQNFQDTFESSNDNTNVVNASREPSVVDQDPGVNISQNPHFGYNCPPKDPIISELELCYNRNFDCFPHDSQTLSQQYLTPPVTSMEMLHAQTDLIGAMQDFLKKYDHIPHKEKSIAELLAEERLQKANQALNESQSPQEMRIQDLE
ncbi:hypothetical protein Tco_0777174, partial [Tanacetum coccineum]